MTVSTASEQGLDARDRHIVSNGQAAIDIASRVWQHARSEFLSDIPTVMGTVADQEPLIYSVPHNGAIHGFSTHDDVRAHYREVYDAIVVKDWRPAIELRSSWYVMFDGVVRMFDKAAQREQHMQSAILFPMDEQNGILGEMVWNRLEEPPGFDQALDGIRPEIAQRDGNRDLFFQYVDALKREDAGVVAGLFLDDAGVSARSHAQTDTAQYVCRPDGGLRHFYADLFDRFEISDVDQVQLVVSDWYVFAELQWQVRDRSTHRDYHFHTADILPIARQGRFTGRIGWGTELVPIANHDR